MDGMRYNQVNSSVGDRSACRRSADSTPTKLPSPPVWFLARDPHWGIFSLANPMRSNGPTVASIETSPPPLLSVRFQEPAESTLPDFLD